MTRQNRRVKIAMRWPDDRVSAFDENGREISELLGSYDGVRDKLLARTYAKTVFQRAVVSTRLVRVNKEEW